MIGSNGDTYLLEILYDVDRIYSVLFESRSFSPQVTIDAVNELVDIFKNIKSHIDLIEECDEMKIYLYDSVRTAISAILGSFFNICIKDVHTL
ncbi:hypothetical protein EON71_00500 [bacterium]|nr:MAG: hypothetical protein EON71_00500 [bacterium]